MLFTLIVVFIVHQSAFYTTLFTGDLASVSLYRPTFAIEIVLTQATLMLIYGIIQHDFPENLSLL